jgi:hypothetical protein
MGLKLKRDNLTHQQIEEVAWSNESNDSLFEHQWTNGNIVRGLILLKKYLKTTKIHKG